MRSLLNLYYIESYYIVAIADMNCRVDSITRFWIDHDEYINAAVFLETLCIWSTLFLSENSKFLAGCKYQSFHEWIIAANAIKSFSWKLQYACFLYRGPYKTHFLSYCIVHHAWLRIPLHCKSHLQCNVVHARHAINNINSLLIYYSVSLSFCEIKLFWAASPLFFTWLPAQKKIKRNSDIGHRSRHWYCPRVPNEKEYNYISINIRIFRFYQSYKMKKKATHKSWFAKKS